MTDDVTKAVIDRWSVLLFGRACEPVSVVTRMGMRATQLRDGHDALTARGIPTEDEDGNTLDIVQRIALLAGDDQQGATK